MEEYDRAGAHHNRGLDKRKSWLRCTFAGMEDAVVLTDANGLITFLNPAAQSMTGWSLTEARDRAWDTRLQFIDAQTRQRIDPARYGSARGPCGGIPTRDVAPGQGQSRAPN